PVHEPFDPMTAKPTATATAPAMAATTGRVRPGGGPGETGAAGVGGAAGSSIWGRSMSATRSRLSRASATVQTSQVFDFVEMGSAAGAGPSVENRRATVL